MKVFRDHLYRRDLVAVPMDVSLVSTSQNLSLITTLAHSGAPGPLQAWKLDLAQVIQYQV